MLQGKKLKISDTQRLYAAAFTVAVCHYHSPLTTYPLPAGSGLVWSFYFIEWESTPLDKIKYIIFSFPRYNNKALSSASQHVSRIWRKVRKRNALLETMCLKTRFPGSLCRLCYVWNPYSAKLKKGKEIEYMKRHLNILMFHILVSMAP